MRKFARISVALLVVLAGVGAVSSTAAAASGTTASSASAPASDTAAETPPDPETDVIGWEDGYWYNESVTVDRADGLNDSELHAVVSRSMARVEKIRKLEFQKRVPVDIISRQEYANRTQNDTSKPPVDWYLHSNTKWEAMFMVNESANSIEVRASSSSASVGGYYSPAEERIVIISENTTSPKMDEITLSQELFHALQDQRFNISSFNQTTTELHNAKDGIIEGDGNYVDYLYEQRCEAEWDCLMPLPSNGSGGGAGEVHPGILVTQLVPYQEGPELVRMLHQQRGWDAVNDLYRNPPDSTEQIIHPEKLNEEMPGTVEIDHAPSNGWHVLELDDGINYAQFGEGGLYAMLWYASYEKSIANGKPMAVTIPYGDLFVYQEGSTDLKAIGGYNYSHPATAGWAGDKLVPYVRGDLSRDAPTGYVWKSRWDTEQDAREFASAYRDLLRYHGAEQVGKHTWRIAEGKEFADAFHLIVDGKTVTVVNAPSVDQLSNVHGAVNVGEKGTPTPSPTPSSTPTATSTPSDAATSTGAANATSTSTGTGTGSTSPGFGLVAAVLALFAVVALVRRRD